MSEHHIIIYYLFLWLPLYTSCYIYIKDKIIEKYQEFPDLLEENDFNIDKLPKLIDMMNLVEVEDDSHFKYAWNEIIKVDERRNQKYSDSHPEFYKIIQEYINEKV